MKEFKTIKIKSEMVHPPKSEALFTSGDITAVLGIVLILSVFRSFNYLLFHSTAELFSIVVASGIFMLAWTMRRNLDNGSFRLLGIAYLFIGGIDLFHMLSYTGMGIIQHYRTDVASQLWISARFLESATLFIAPFLARARIRIPLVFGLYTLLCGLILMSIFYWENFPPCFIEGRGLTSFKIFAEYAICALFAGSAVGFVLHRKKYDRRIWTILLISVAVTIGSELLFTLYTDPYDLTNTVGHFLKIISFALIYKALFQTAVYDPSQVLFSNLTRSADLLRSERDRLYKILDSMDDGVSIVTADFVIDYVNPSLEKEFGPIQKNTYCYSYIEKRDTPCPTCRIQKVLAGKRVRHTLTASNEKVYDIIETPLYNADGTVSKLKIYRDVTDSQRMLETLEASEKKYRSLFENMIDGFALHEIVLDDSGATVDYRFLECNSSFERITGLPRESVIGKKVTEVIPGIKDDPADWIGRYGHIARTAGNIRFEQYAHGLNKWFSVSAYGMGSGIFCTIFEDITDRKNAEEAVRTGDERLRQTLQTLQQQTAELKRVNNELESFSYSASHDLRAPLRTISGFAELLAQNYKEHLDTRGKHYLERICAASGKMNQLIEDLLNLSRVSRYQMIVIDTNLSAIATQCSNELCKNEPDRDVCFSIQQDMRHKVDNRLMLHVIENLVHNAWKFTSRSNSAHISFGRYEQDEQYVYFIRDNGAGFDSTYAHKLFTPFSRLHSESEFPGTGIGLAIVKRIIERHGGKTWAESSIGDGTTVYFALPICLQISSSPEALSD